MTEIDEILDFSRRIARAYRPQRIVLFGSHAYGKPRANSDVDLLVIGSFRGNAFDRATEMLQCVPATFPVDLLIRSAADTARRYRQFDPLIREALDRGKVLYERNGKGMVAQGRRRFQHRASGVARAKVA